MHRLLPGVALLAASLFATAASAQNPDAPLKGRDSDPNLPSQTQTPPDKVRPDDWDEPIDTRGMLIDVEPRDAGRSA